MKKLNPTVLILAIFALLGGYIFFFERGPVKVKEDDKTAKKIKIFPQFVADDIQRIKIENLGTTLTAQKSPIEIQKDAKGVWQIESPKKFKADESIMRTYLTGVGDFNPDDAFDNPANLADYGLNSPTARCSFTPKTGPAFVLLAGDKNAAGSSTYVKTPNKNTVYLLPSGSVDTLIKKVNDFRDHTFFKTDSVLAKKIQITRDGNVVTFEKGKDNVWTLTAPVKAKADSGKIKDLLNSINGLRLDEFVEDHPSNLAIYGLSSPRAKVEVWDRTDTTPDVILLGRKKLKTSSYFAKAGDSPYVSLVGEFFDKTMDIKVSDYRDKTTLQFDSSLAKTLTIKRNGKTFVYQKGDKGTWTSEGRPQAQSEASNILSGLSGIMIIDFAGAEAKTGLKTPSFGVEIAMTDGTTRTFRFGNREKDQIYLASGKNKNVYLVSAMVVSQMETYYSPLLTPIPVTSPIPVPK